jgi:hypothetical protein
VKGHLDREWSGWLEKLMITRNNQGETIISGGLRDQVVFYGLLTKLSDMGLLLILVNYMADESFKEKDDSDENS